MKIIITESQLENIVSEQVVPTAPDDYTGDSDSSDTKIDQYELGKLTKYLTCLPNDEIAGAVFTAVKQKNKLKKLSGISSDELFFTILKYAVGILGRETDYGLGSLQDKGALVLRNIPGGDFVMDSFESIYGQGLSLGPAQFTIGAWKKYGLDKKVGDFDNIGNLFMSLIGAFYRIATDYQLAIKRGLGDTASINPIAVKQGKIKSIDGTGNISMDLAIIAHNMGQEKIKKYCKTSDARYNAPCDSKNGKYKPFKDKPAIDVYTDKWVPGYFPNLGFKKGEGTLTSIGYLEEVVKRANGITCLT